VEVNSNDEIVQKNVDFVAFGIEIGAIKAYEQLVEDVSDVTPTWIFKGCSY
jgi:hypothetical protein